MSLIPNCPFLPYPTDFHGKSLENRRIFAGKNAGRGVASGAICDKLLIFKSIIYSVKWH